MPARRGLRNLLHRPLSTHTAKSNLTSLRNIGIAAHVDAGKTTVVERLLFFSNKTHGMGEVHEGATTMDYLPQERERGITINSAAISFSWNQHQINLIDTPGHFDFGFEVERSMRVMDGAVIVLDAVNGVEAQTEQVWAQAERYGVARIALANKMDRSGASLELCSSTLAKRLNAHVLALHAPLGEWAAFRGVVDLVHMTRIEWPDSRGGAELGRVFSVSPLTPELAAEMAPKREALLERIADVDDAFAELFLSAQQPLPPAPVKAALARTVLAQIAPVPGTRPALPLVCGAALRNIGMQPLLDAVVDYLPSPLARSQAQLYAGALPLASAAGPLSALVFKVQHDAQRGPLCFVRIYSGVLKVKDAIKGSSSNNKPERVQALLRAEADEFLPVPGGQAAAGDVVVVTGCNSLVTGDSIGPGAALRPIRVPPAIFAVSLELESAAQEAKLEAALAIACRDDPSLHAHVDAETGQLLLSGVGELHLDVAVDRLKREHGLALYASKPQVALRERVVGPCQAEFALDKVLAGKREMCTLKMALKPIDVAAKPIVKTGSLPFGEARSALVQGCLAALSRGPRLGRPMCGVEVDVVSLEPPLVSPMALRAAAAGCVELLLRTGRAVVLEPVCRVVVNAPVKDTGAVLGDLTGSRRAQIVQVDTLGERSLVEAKVPAKEMLDYSKALRSLTAGHGAFASSFDGYGEVAEGMW